ncbi:DsbA family oxidoreductase [uncultured Pluralibacter sp.]|uniref:DsbA family oxidoreductase n=1 Tax=uncultured Pluralibacter sp. TaxID=1490864 RepID=UPI002617653F|nr:DsbA family oxidoreductase [uncultured Pluralibacter sp.]
MKISISVTSDFICPWCRIAEARLEKVLRMLPSGVVVDVDWKPFELNPDMPAEGVDRRTYRSTKFGSWEYSLRLDQHTVDAGRADNVIFNYSAIQRVPNTFASHRLISLAAPGVEKTRLVKRIFQAYFEEGLDIGNVHILSGLAEECGMNREDVLKFLSGHSGVENLRQQEARARLDGINSVPFFDIAGTRVSGAVGADLLYQHIMGAYHHGKGECDEH